MLCTNYTFPIACMEFNVTMSAANAIGSIPIPHVQNFTSDGCQGKYVSYCVATCIYHKVNISVI